MSHNPTSICNQALIVLGADIISSIDDDNNKHARLFNRIYETYKRSCLGSAMWTFAEKREDLSSPITNPTRGFNEFVPSSEFIKIFRVYRQANFDAPVPRWVRNGRNVLVPNHIGAITVVGTKDTGENLFTDLFVEALAYKLAWAVCIPVTKNRGLKKDMKEDYLDALDIAIASDGQQAKSEIANTSSLIKVRRR